jgi:hypothetical protein
MELRAGKTVGGFSYRYDLGAVIAGLPLQHKADYMPPFSPVLGIHVSDEPDFFLKNT